MPTTLMAVLAFLFFAPLFVLHHLGPLDFWWWMALNLVALISLACLIDAGFRGAMISDLKSQIARKCLIGFGSALVLYVVFWAGNNLSRHMFASAGRGIAAVYDFKQGASTIRVALLMAGIIGPGEEIFWRGYLQRGLALRIGPTAGFFAVTALYTGIHVFSGNPMLILAALICGLFWGALYLRFESVLLNAVSHTVWDVAVFLLFPFAQPGGVC